MSTTGRILVVAVAAACASQADATDASALAKTSQCTVCHATEARQVGPSFKEIAAKYKADEKAEDKLAASIRSGSTGKWGPVPMPPNGAVSDSDAHALAAWILSQ